MAKKQHTDALFKAMPSHVKRLRNSAAKNAREDSRREFKERMLARVTQRPTGQ